MAGEPTPGGRADLVWDMGEAGRRRVAGITWDHVIDRLTESLR